MSRKAVFRITTAAAAASATTGTLVGYCLGRRSGHSESEGFSVGGVSNFEKTGYDLRNDEQISNQQWSFNFDGSTLLHKLFSPGSVHAKAVPIRPVSDEVTVTGPTNPGGGASVIGELVKYGFPSMENLRSFQDYVLSYDKRNRTANWVLEHLTPEKLDPNNGVERKKMEFVEDDSFHSFHRSTNKDYAKSGYDRGHLAAAANHKQSEKAMAETFRLSNVAPQVGEGFNRSAWNNLEKYVRAIARKAKNTYVCTGPLYLPRKEPDGKLYVKYEVIGPNHVAVPTHFFKVLVIENHEGQLELMSFVMPNQPLPDVKLKAYLMPLETIERAAGLSIFQNIPRKDFKKIYMSTSS